MNACIIFEVSDRVQELKEILKTMGYWRAWVANDKTYTLPINSIWKPDCELSQAKNDLIKAIADLNKKSENTSNSIRLVRCIVLAVNPWDGIEGDTY